MAAKVARQRVDRLLVERGLAPSRERAQAMLLAGKVRLAGQRIDKAGTLIAEDAELSVAEDPCPYVSRGGMKLASVLGPLGVDPAGRVCLDLGASTGGFTDVLLQRGAERVWAVDVGHHQLHEKIRRDPRVRAHEGVNARLGLREVVTEEVSLVVIDVSFISLAKVLPAAVEVLSAEGEVLAMVKPQFELGPALVRGGVVRDDALRARAVDGVAEAAASLGLLEVARVDSAVHGPSGNREIFLHLRRRLDGG